MSRCRSWSKVATHLVKQSILHPKTESQKRLMLTPENETHISRKKNTRKDLIFVPINLWNLLCEFQFTFMHVCLFVMLVITKHEPNATERKYLLWLNLRFFLFPDMGEYVKMRTGGLSHNRNNYTLITSQLWYLSLVFEYFQC